MASEPIPPSLASISTHRDIASKALSALEVHRDLISACISKWQELERCFSAAEKSLQQKFTELAERETEFDAQTQEARTALDEREAALARREEASLALVKEEKDSALAEILEERKKLEHERSRKNNGENMESGSARNANCEGRKDPEENASEKAVVTVAKETELHGKGAGLGSVTDATTEKGTLAKGNADKTALKKKRKDKQPVNEASVKRPKETPVPNKQSLDTQISQEAISQVKRASEVHTVSEMKLFIDKMDGKSLLELLAQNMKDIPSCGSDLLSVLQSCTNPCHLVLKAFEGYEEVKSASFGNKTTQACILLLEKLSEIMNDPTSGAAYREVPADDRELAKTVARTLKSKVELNRKDDYNNAHLFLQFLITFGLGAEYKDECLLECVASLSRHGTGPVLCQTLGLTEKIPALVEKLIKDKKQLEAISFASTFGIMDKIDPGNILRSYLKDSERAAQSLIEKAWSKASGLNDAHLKQVSALKHAIKTIEEYNLSSFLSPEELKKQIAALEEKKMERKKVTSTLKQQKFSRNVQGTNSFSASGVKSGNNFNAERNYMPTDFRRSIGHDHVPADFGPSFHSYRPLNQYDYDRRQESDYSFDHLNPVSRVNPYVRDSAGPAMYPGISGSNVNYLPDNRLPPSSYLPFYRR